jgi:hypothetical protein
VFSEGVLTLHGFEKLNAIYGDRKKDRYRDHDH